MKFSNASDSDLTYFERIFDFVEEQALKANTDHGDVDPLHTIESLWASLQR